MPLEAAPPPLAMPPPVPTPADLLAHTAELEHYAAAEAVAAKQRLAKEALVLPHHVRRPTPTPSPALEVTVMRVVGCDMLTNSRTGRDFTVVTFAGGWAAVGDVKGMPWHPSSWPLLWCAPLLVAALACPPSGAGLRCAMPV